MGEERKPGIGDGKACIFVYNESLVYKTTKVDDEFISFRGSGIYKQYYSSRLKG